MNLHIGDKYKRIVDVMNNCCGWNYTACFKGWYSLNSHKKTSAWFPKIADLRGETPEPGDKWYGWCNILSEDENTIYMNNFEDPSRLSNEPPAGIEPHVTFIKLPHSDVYQFAGVFARTRRDPKLGWVYERIAQDINTKDYL